MKRLFSCCTAVLLATMSVACSSDDPVGPEGPSIEDVVGRYEATELTLAGEDLLTLGTSLELVLNADQSVSGELVIPEAAGGPLTADMAGDFLVRGEWVVINQAAETFVGAIEWAIVSPRVLRGRYSSSQGRVLIRLEGTPIP